MKFSTIIFLYVVAWFVFAIFDFDGSDTIVAYNLSPTLETSNNVPKMLSLTPTTYHISGQSVVLQDDLFEPRLYTDCAVIDAQNWVCTYDDKSGKFGFQDGRNYRTSLTGETFGTENWQAVSRFGYILNKVKWYLAALHDPRGGHWTNVFSILFLPFVY